MMENVQTNNPFLPWISRCVIYTTRYVPIKTNINIYYILSHEFHGYTFRLISGQLQAIKIRKDEQVLSTQVRTYQTTLIYFSTDIPNIL